MSEFFHFFEGSASLTERLERVLAHFGADAGTVHRLEGTLLRLAAHAHIPPPVLAWIETVPVGKGMAGLAAERCAPVQVCNLQTDGSGAARPGARATGLEGSIAVPMLAAGELQGVLGIAKRTPYDWTEAESADLLAVAAQLSAEF